MDREGGLFLIRYISPGSANISAKAGLAYIICVAFIPTPLVKIFPLMSLPVGSEALAAHGVLVPSGRLQSLECLCIC